MNPEDREYLRQLYLEMYEELVGYLNASLRDELLSQELTQAVFLAAAEKPEAVRTSPNPQGWLYRTAKNILRNNQKTTAHRLRLMSDYLEVYGLESAVYRNPENVMLQYGDIAETKEFRLMYDMAILGKTHEELAREQGITVAVCKKRVERAKKYLRKKLNFMNTR